MEVDPSSQSPNGSDTTFWAFGAPVPKQPPFLSIPAAVRAGPVFVFLLVFYLYFWRRFFHKKHGFFFFFKQKVYTLRIYCFGRIEKVSSASKA